MPFEFLVAHLHLVAVVWNDSELVGEKLGIEGVPDVVSVNTVLLRFGLLIGSRSSLRWRKPSASGVLGTDVAGVK